jgi:mRNA interferase MazF
MTTKQYEIYWVDLNPSRGSEINKIRPCVIVSPDDMNNYLNTIIVAPITSTLKSYPFRLSCDIGYIALDQLRTVDKTRFRSFIQKLTASNINDLKHILNEMLVE